MQETVVGDAAASEQVIVVGGGIGGLAAAVALSQQGFTVTVLERSPEFSEIGAGLQLAPNATRVLRSYGLLDQVLDVGVVPDRLVLASAETGEELTHLPLDDFEERYGGPYVVVHRSDLLSILHRQCLADPSITLHPARMVVGVEQTAGSVTVTCANGETYTGTVAIGADGLHSTVRKLLSDDEPICSGYVAYRGALPREVTVRPLEANDVVAFIGPGMHFVQYPIRRGELYNQVAVFHSRRFDAGEAEWGGPDEMDEAFAGACEHVRVALQSIGRDASWPMYDRLPIPNWRSGRVALLGDAAHPMLQYLAQGACQALADGYELARSLRQAADDQIDLVEGLEAYQKTRTVVTAKIQSNARTWGDIWHADGVAQILRDTYLRERDVDDHRHIEPIYGLAREVFGVEADDSAGLAREGVSASV